MAGWALESPGICQTLLSVQACLAVSLPNLAGAFPLSQLYQCSAAAGKNDHKLGVLQQLKFILSQSWRQKFKIKVSIGLCSSQGSRRASLLASPASGGLWCSFACGHIPPKPSCGFPPVSVTQIFLYFLLGGRGL